MKGYQLGKPVSPKAMVDKIMTTYGMSQRRACQIMGRSYQHVRLSDEDEIIEQIVQFARDYSRYGYRRIAAKMHIKSYAIRRAALNKEPREEARP